MACRFGEVGWLVSWCKLGRVARTVGRDVPTGMWAFELAQYESGCHWHAVAGAPGEWCAGP